MRPLHGRFGFRCGLSFDVEERRDERHLKFDLLATQCGRAGQGRDLIEGARELSNPLRTARSAPATAVRLCPKVPRPSRLTRQQFRLAFDNLGKLAFECFSKPFWEA
jgi:hypothetical protein